jgi:hypothetical protein
MHFGMADFDEDEAHLDRDSSSVERSKDFQAPSSRKPHPKGVFCFRTFKEFNDWKNKHQPLTTSGLYQEHQTPQVE